MKGKRLVESWPIPRRTTPRAYFEERIRGAVEKALALPFGIRTDPAILPEDIDTAEKSLVHTDRGDDNPRTLVVHVPLPVKDHPEDPPGRVPGFVVSVQSWDARTRRYPFPDYGDPIPVFVPAVEGSDQRRLPRVLLREGLPLNEQQGLSNDELNREVGARIEYTHPRIERYEPGWDEYPKRIRVLQGPLELGPLPPSKARRRRRYRGRVEEFLPDLVQVTFAGLTNAPRLDEAEPEEMEYEVIARSRSRTRALEMFDRLIDELKFLSSVDIDSDGELRTETGEYVIPIAVNYVTRAV